MRKLTAKQHKFVEGLISGMGQSEAYRAAYNCSRMKAETIRSKAYLLSNQDNIRAMVEAARQKAEDAAIWSRKEALAQLAKIAKADLRNFLEYHAAETVVGYTEDGDPIIDWGVVMTVMDSGEVDGTLIQEIQVQKDGTVKFKLHDKLKAIEIANRMCGYNEPDKVEFIKGDADLEEMLRLAGYKKDD